jgi:hypothetical protein
MNVFRTYSSDSCWMNRKRSHQSVVRLYITFELCSSFRSAFTFWLLPLILVLTMMTSLICYQRKRDEPMSSPASTSLTDLSEELLILVLANLDFRQRSVTRRVCRTLCRLADSLPPPEELEVKFYRSQEESPADAVSVNRQLLEYGHCVVECNHATTRIAILLDHEIEIETDTEQRRLLQLRAIRPVQLKLDAFYGIDSDLLRRVVDQVAGTVTSLSVARLETASPRALYDTFSAFRNNGRLTHLRLEAFTRIRSTLFAVASLTSLVRLDLVISARAFSEWENASSGQAEGFGLNLIALQSLPSLRELSISMKGFFQDARTHDEFITGFLLGCSAIHQIRVLSCEFLFDFNYVGEANALAFALMLCRLENLEEFSKVVSPSVTMWGHVHMAGGHSKMQKLSIFYSEATEADLEGTVQAMVRDFPALVTLELELAFHDVTLERTTEILAGLRSHSGMANLAVSLEHTYSDLDANQVDDFLRMLQKDLGPNISVTAIESSLV